MRLPIDTSGITFLLVRDALPVRDFETKQHRADADGVPLYQVQVVAMGDGEADIVTVKVPGEPEGLTQGGPVRFEGLTAQPWHIGDKSGVAFRAEAIRDGAASTSSTSSKSSAA